jgi:hypothetical protein
MVHTFAHLHILPAAYFPAAATLDAPARGAFARPSSGDCAREAADPMPLAGADLIRGWPQNAYLGLWGEWRGL